MKRGDVPYTPNISSASPPAKICVGAYARESFRFPLCATILAQSPLDDEAKLFPKYQIYYIISSMIILGIETSCDDTCASIIKASGSLRAPKFKILSNVVSSQVKIHKKYGGVMPAMAARAHAKNIVPVYKKAFKEAGIKPKKIDLIAVTTHPGLMPALLVGVHSARALAWVLKKPLLGIDHMQGHAVAHLLTNNSKTIKFPAIGLLVSGEHTQIILIRDYNNIKLVGETLDDAAGEAFDKVARLLGLPFPGGPPIAACAAKFQSSKSKTQIKLPRPMLKSNDYNFSFSGLKTAVLYLVQDLQKKYGKRLPTEMRNEICAEFQQAALDVLIIKTIKAAKEYRAKTIIIGGGVASNKELRKQLAEKIEQNLPKTKFQIPTPAMSLDNAAMIATAAYFNWKKGKRSTWKNVKVKI